MCLGKFDRVYVLVFCGSLFFASLVWETATNSSNSYKVYSVFDLDCVSLYFEFFVFLNYQVAYCRFFYNLHILKK